MRAWRHPSEIAAAAAAAKDDPESGQPAAWPQWLRSNVTAVAAMTAFVALAGAAGVALTTLDPQAKITLAADSGTSKLDRLSTTLQTNARTPTTGPNIADVTSSTTLPEAGKTSGRSEIDAKPDAGVYSAGGGDGGGGGERLGAFVVVNDMLFTSSSATKGHETIELRVDGESIDAKIIARDPLNDLALLEVDPTAQTVVGPVAASACELEEGKAMGSSIMVMAGEDEQLRLEQGVVIGADESILSSSGHRIFGSLVTTARRQTGTAGSALVDQDGCVVGLVVDTPDYLAAAVPIDRVIGFGESYLQWGVASTEWLGLAGSSPPDGGVAVDEVLVGGPAANSLLAPGDLILAADGHEVLGSDHLTYLVRQAGVGNVIELTVVHDGATIRVPITIGLKPADDTP